MPLIQKLFIWYFKAEGFHPIIAHHALRLLIQHLYIFLFAPLLSQPAWASAIFLYPETCTLLEEVEKSIREFGVRKSFMKEVK
jgi:hypothetical protein